MAYGELWVEWRWAHDEWAGRPEVRYRYGGKEWDEESGLYYFGARYYRAEVGLWLSPDPEGVRLVSPMEGGAPKAGYSLAEAAIWYGYCSYNPLRYVDPEGGNPLLVGALVGIGALGLTACTPPPPKERIEAVMEQLRNAHYGQLPSFQSAGSSVYAPRRVTLPRDVWSYLYLVAAAFPKDADMSDIEYTGAQEPVSPRAAARASRISGVMGAVGLLGAMFDNIRDDEGNLVGSVILVFEKNKYTGKISWWELEYISAENGGQKETFSREQALAFMEAHKELFGHQKVEKAVRDAIYKQVFQRLE